MRDKVFKNLKRQFFYSLIVTEYEIKDGLLLSSKIITERLNEKTKTRQQRTLKIFF